MGRDVKEKESRKDIKLLNKAEIVSGHLKDSVVKTKMDVSEAQDEDRTCPSTYAGEKFSAGTKKVADLLENRFGLKAKKLYNGSRKYEGDSQAVSMSLIIQLMNRNLEQKMGRQTDKTIC